jgi:hypothetical protein
MEENEAIPRLMRVDWGLILLLMALAVAMRAWQLTHTEVPARDTIGYVRMAWQLGQRPWREVLPKSSQHPGYPAVLLLASLPIRYFVRDDLAYAMQLSAQLTSALASVLLVLPLYCLGRELFDRRVSFWAALLFQCLPAGGRLMGDGLSEPVFLLWVATALWLAARALRGQSAVCFALTGAFAGLAYLTRPEGLVVVAATGLVLLGMQAVKRWRRPWGTCLALGTCLVVGCLAVGGPYALAIRGLTVKLTPLEIMKQDLLGNYPEKKAALDMSLPVGVATSPALLATWWHGEQPQPGEAARTRWGLLTLVSELTKGFFYVVWVPALWGLWLFRDRFRLVPGSWVLLLVGLMIVFALFRVAAVAGYLSERHALLIILGGCYWAVAALLTFGHWLAARMTRLRPAMAGTVLADGRFWSGAVLAALCGTALIKSLEPLHADRAGFRQAGYWLAQHTQPGDLVHDTYSWSHYYAGRVFLEGAKEALPAHQPPVCYVVLEQSRNDHPRHVERLAEAKALAERGHVVFSWKVPRHKDEAEILVYEVPREKTSQ